MTPVTTEERLRVDLDRFIGDVSHDLSGPLHTVTGLLELLMTRVGASLGPQDREYVEYASQAATRAATRLGELVDEARARVREAAGA